MPTPTAALTRRIVRTVQSYTSGKPQQWVPTATIARLVMVKDEAFLDAALQVGIDQGWLIVEGGHSVCLTDEGRRLVVPR